MAYQARKKVRSVQLTPTIYTAGAMASGDAMHTSALEIADILQHNASGHIKSVVISDLDKKNTDLDVVFFKANPSTSTITAGDAIDIADSELLDVIGYVSVVAANYADFADNSVAGKECEIPFAKEGTGVINTSSSTARSLWCVLVSRDTDTFSTATALTLTVNIETD